MKHYEFIWDWNNERMLKTGKVSYRCNVRFYRVTYALVPKFIVERDDFVQGLASVFRRLGPIKIRYPHDLALPWRRPPDRKRPRDSCARDLGSVGRHPGRAESSRSVLHYGRGRAVARRACHCVTSRATFGASPKISGAYIASTRVAGNWKVPALFRRIV